jgi:uncharacterized protein (TIGR02611 family)
MDDGDSLEQDLDRWQSEGGTQPALSVPSTPAAGWSRVRQVLRISRKVGVAIAGGVLVLAGIALVVLPGPALVVIPLGLALLATEFRWAERLLRYLKGRVARVLQRVRRGLRGRPRSQVGPPIVSGGEAPAAMKA